MARATALIRQALCTQPLRGASTTSPLSSLVTRQRAFVAGVAHSRSGIRVRGLAGGAGFRPKSTAQGVRCEAEDAGSSEYVKWRSGGGTVHSQAEVHSSVVVENGALVDSKARVGANARISAGCVVGPGVCVGEATTLGYNVVLQNCSVGASCTLHPGVCVGQDGFGFLENRSGEIVKKPQLLRVQIGDHVEIGANTCIDRGSWRDTVIGDYTKIDNLVQIGHNAWIGRGCMLCGQVGIAGSATVGDYVVIGGKAGVSDHVSVASRVRIAAKSGVMSNIDTPGDYAGFPAVPAREWRKQMVVLRRMGRPAVKEFPSEGEAPGVENH
jgi:UDP-3-O-[3-hydroxymyristoyl] glucosamine N-acyltransferase LpxD